MGDVTDLKNKKHPTAGWNAREGKGDMVDTFFGLTASPRRTGGLSEM